MAGSYSTMTRFAASYWSTWHRRSATGCPLNFLVRINWWVEELWHWLHFGDHDSVAFISCCVVAVAVGPGLQSWSSWTSLPAQPLRRSRYSASDQLAVAPWPTSLTYQKIIQSCCSPYCFCSLDHNIWWSSHWSFGNVYLLFCHHRSPSFSFFRYCIDLISLPSSYFWT